MSAHTEFDLGSLIWVKGEIDQALEKARQSLAKYANQADAAELKFAQTHLHQVRGAVEMVGLSGASRFAEELEVAVGAVERGEADGSMLKLVSDAAQSLTQYLEALVNGSPDPTHRWLVQTTERFAQKAGIQTPEVGIYDGAPNAFATGAFKNSALVAVSTGLLQSMTKEEVEAVIGHEVAHVANGDMVTMALIQGVMNTFVVFLSRVIGYFVDKVVLRNTNDGPGMGYYITTIVLDILLGVVAAIIVAWFSRQREYRADADAATLMGRKQPMINALARLGGLDPGEMPKAMQAMGISARPSGLMALFSSHPPMEERIARLKGQ